MTNKMGQPNANAVPFWVRLMITRRPAAAGGEQTIKAGTLGLHIFGLRELEYAPAALEPQFVIQHAYSVAEYLLSSGKRLGDGETIGVEGQAGFAVSYADKGDFVSFPVARLSLQPKT
jgi:hypothetical protein